MATSWADKWPRVTVPRADRPKPVTFVYPYYMNAQFFEMQVAGWSRYPAELRPFLSAIVVDDGSPEPAQVPHPVPFPIRLFRIHEDRRWNWLAARNIGAHHAADGWLLLTDMDHVVPPETAQALVWGQHDPKIVYVFSRREHSGEPVPPHSASFLMTRRMFWKVGGYDERYSGIYGSDGIYRRRLSRMAPLQVLPDVLVRYEYVSDSSTTAYQRKQPEDAQQLKTLVASLPPNAAPKVLTFPYEEVSCSAS